MKQSKVIDRLLSEILFETTKESILHGLTLAYGVGFNDGRKSIKARNKKVIQLNLIGQPIKLWDSLTEAQHATGIPYQTIGQCALGKRKTAGGFKWAYPDINTSTKYGE